MRTFKFVIRILNPIDIPPPNVLTKGTSFVSSSQASFDA